MAHVYPWLGPNQLASAPWVTLDAPQPQTPSILYPVSNSHALFPLFTTDDLWGESGKVLTSKVNQDLGQGVCGGGSFTVQVTTCFLMRNKGACRIPKAPFPLASKQMAALHYHALFLLYMMPPAAVIAQHLFYPIVYVPLGRILSLSKCCWDKANPKPIHCWREEACSASPLLGSLFKPYTMRALSESQTWLGDTDLPLSRPQALTDLCSFPAPLGWSGVWNDYILTRGPLPPANLTSITVSPEGSHLQQHQAHCQCSINNARDQEKQRCNKDLLEQGAWSDNAPIQRAWTQTEPLTGADSRNNSESPFPHL